MLWDFTKEKFDIIIQAGQSNAKGNGGGNVDNHYAPTNEILHMENDFTIGVAKERVEGNYIFSHFGLTFAKKYIEEGRLPEGRRVLIIRSAVGGTGFSDHHWGMQDDLYLRMMEMTRTALALNPENRIVAFLWHQGETDALNNVGEAEYYGYLNTLIDSVRNEFGGDIPVVCGDFVQEWKGANVEICAPIITAQRKLVEAIPHAAFVETDGLASNLTYANIGGDVIHFCRPAQYELGHRYYDAFIKAEQK